MKVEIAGVQMDVVGSDVQAADLDYVVCMPEGSPSPFDDNLVGACCKCGTAVIFRPHVPKAVPRICLECVIALVQEHEAKP